MRFKMIDFVYKLRYNKTTNCWRINTLKKKLFALCLCLCMVLSCFCGCSLLTKQPTYTSDTVIATIAGENITYADLLSKYNNYSKYFAYYDEDVVMKIIYEELYLGVVQEIQAKNTVVLEDKDYEEIKKSVYDAFISTIDSYEKALIESDDKELPDRLSDNKSEDNKTYSEYVFEPVEVIDFSTLTAGTAPTVDQMYLEFLDKVYDGVENKFEGYRTQAYNKLVAALLRSAKLDGKTSDKVKVVKDAIKEQYESAFTTKICAKYREYIESKVFVREALTESEQAILFQQEIVNKYKKLLNADKQKYSIGGNYAEIIASTSSTDLILYHYEGEYTFFTVQHLLVKFDDDTVAELKNHVGYDSGKAEIFRKEYEKFRLGFARNSSGEWIISGSYRDEDGETIKEQDYEKNDDGTYKVDESGNKILAFEKDENGEYKLDENNEKIPVMVESKITLQAIVDKFEEAISSEEKYLAMKLGDKIRKVKADLKEEKGRDLTDEEKAEIESTTALTIDEENKAKDEFNNNKSYVRLSTFMRFIYMYTGDTSALGSDKNIMKLGYSISTDKDDNGGLMKEFADGGRNLYNRYISLGLTLDNFLASDENVEFAITDYGVHMMMLTGVYNAGEIVKIEKDNGSGEMVARSDAEIIADLKATRITASSTKTLYEYIYDALKTEKANTLYSEHLYKLLDEIQSQGKFKEIKKPTYHDLSGR